MTTRAGEDGIRHSDPVFTSRRDFKDSSATAPSWEQYIESRIQGSADAVFDGVDKITEKIGEMIGEVSGRLGKRITELELKLATAVGALDVLRGKGMPGSFNFKGTYSPKSVYNHLDVVTNDSSSFVALKDNPGPCPGSGWQMIACGGKRGPAGERGPQGPAAPPLRWVDTGLNFRDGIALEARLSDQLLMPHPIGFAGDRGRWRAAPLRPSARASCH